ncbi:MAG TPA: hypothetical protein ENN65_06710, partial [Candidatus Hydrogenedentes bacterium]|nr:hypothetical protein [Candidatus Hydrogenedentota bacterium]
MKNNLCGPLLAAVLAVCGTLTAQAVATEEQAMIQENPTLAPDAFAEKVAAGGGHVDFVFGDERPFAQC